jgi:molybdopterin-containing oxidoreductase family membrane subunit
MFMFEKAIIGGRRYWTWIAALAAVAGLGALGYSRQLDHGLAVTGLSRDVTWGLYIAQFTFLVGVAASAVVVVLPFYLHDYRAFARVTILGEFLAIAAVVMSGLFIFIDLGQPSRVLNVVLFASPSSMMFWDLLALGGYLALNAVITLVTLSAERRDVAPPRWIVTVIIVSIPWAISIHTVTAFLYNGLPGRPFWLTALLAPRFLASAFATGPALLVLLCLAMRRLTRFDAGGEPIRRLGLVVTYAMLVNAFFVLLELFTVFYARIPGHMEAYTYLFFGIGGHAALVPWMWASVLTGLAALGLLLLPVTRSRTGVLAAACALVVVSLWIDKGLGLVVGGFVPSPLGALTEYRPTFNESVIVSGVWAIGFLLVTVFFKITLEVRREA